MLKKVLYFTLFVMCISTVPSVMAACTCGSIPDPEALALCYAEQNDNVDTCEAADQCYSNADNNLIVCFGDGITLDQAKSQCSGQPSFSCCEDWSFEVSDCLFEYDVPREPACSNFVVGAFNVCEDLACQ